MVWDLKVFNFEGGFPLSFFVVILLYGCSRCVYHTPRSTSNVGFRWRWPFFKTWRISLKSKPPSTHSLPSPASLTWNYLVISSKFTYPDSSVHWTLQCKAVKQGKGTLPTTWTGNHSNYSLIFPQVLCPSLLFFRIFWTAPTNFLMAESAVMELEGEM